MKQIPGDGCDRPYDPNPNKELPSVYVDEIHLPASKDYNDLHPLNSQHNTGTSINHLSYGMMPNPSYKHLHQKLKCGSL